MKTRPTAPRKAPHPHALVIVARRLEKTPPLSDELAREVSRTLARFGGNSPEAIDLREALAVGLVVAHASDDARDTRRLAGLLIAAAGEYLQDNNE